MDEHRRVTSVETLHARYGAPSENAVVKELDRLIPEYRVFIEASPFLTIASAGPDGLDCTPRGDAPGFVRVVDERTLIIPDRRGNNRVDTLSNVLHDPRVGLLFLIPGIGETIRVNGRAAISTDPGLLESFGVDGQWRRRVVLVARSSASTSSAARPILRSDRSELPRAHHRRRGSLPKPAAPDGLLAGRMDVRTRYDQAYPSAQGHDV
jgi:PPOX class probable FMN-dependent enzyme